MVVPCAGMHAFFGCAFYGGWARRVIADAFLLIMYVWLALRDTEEIQIEMHSKVLLAWILGLDPSLVLVQVLCIEILKFLAFQFNSL